MANWLRHSNKYESASNIRKLNIEGSKFEGTLSILNGLEQKIKKEVEDCDLNMDDEITEEELSFLREMDVLRMTDAEKEKIIGYTLFGVSVSKGEFSFVIPCVMAWASIAISKELQEPNELIATQYTFVVKQKSI